MPTVQQMQAQIEIWRNTTAGMRWYIAFDARGAVTTKTVYGNRTFTLSTLERQMNQEAAASSAQDLFRNGTFVLSKASEETVEEEIQSPNAMTDQEIQLLVQEVVHGDMKIEDALEGISSAVTLHRIYEALVLEEDTPKHVIDVVKGRYNDEQPTVAVKREIVSTAPPTED